VKPHEQLIASGSPATSILLPVYNGERFLGCQLDSIFAQTDDDFELLAVDDGSNDASAAILADFAAREPRMRVIASDGNCGQTLRLRALVAEARGAFIAIADQDDVWHPDRNRLLRAAIGTTALAFGPSHLIDAHGAQMGVTLLETLSLTPDPTSALRTLFKPLVSAHAALIRRDWIDPAILTHPLPFDWLMSALALHGPGLAYVGEARIDHRIHDANQMNRAAPDTSRRLGGLRNRIAVSLRRPDQLRLWLMLDFLGRSPIDPARRRAFATLASSCRREWFGVPSMRLADRRLRGQLIDTLKPMAGSTDDWNAAEVEIGRITRSLLHPGKAAGLLRS
jgi:glycosyltransferase involved in cell wall biosynthesis